MDAAIKGLKMSNELEIKQTIEDVVLAKQRLVERLAIAVKEVRACQQELERYKADLGQKELIDLTSKYAKGEVFDKVQMHVDRSVWGFLVERTKVGQFMTLDQREVFSKMLYGADRIKPESWADVAFPPLTVNTAHATLLSAVASAGENTELSVVDLFKRLSKHHKSNSGFSFGARLVYERVLGRFDMIDYDMGEKLNEFQRVVDIIEGKVPQEVKYNTPLLIAVAEAFRNGTYVAETDQIRCKLFKNGNAHFYLKNPETIQAMNAIVAKRLGGNVLGKAGGKK